MTSIKNDRPTGARTTSTNETKDLERIPDTSMVGDLDDVGGVTDMEALNPTPTDDANFDATPKPKASNWGAPSPSMRASMALAMKVAPPPSASVTDVPAMVSMFAAAAIDLKPGEKLTLGGKASGAVGIAMGVEAKFEIERLEDGRYEVKIDREASAGVGAQEGFGNANASIKAAVVVGTGASYIVDSYKDAAIIAAEGIVELAMIGTPAGPATSAVMSLVNRSALHEVHYEVGLEFEGEAGIFPGLRDQLVGGGTVGLVRNSSGSVFLEVKGTLESDQAAQAGVGSGEVTLRVPLGTLPEELLTDAGAQRRLLERAQGNPPGATLSFEGELEVGGVAGGVTTSLEGEVDGYRLDDLFSAGKWTARAGAKLGPDLDENIGPLTAEVTFQKTEIYYEGKAASPAAALADVEAHRPQIAAKLK